MGLIRRDVQVHAVGDSPAWAGSATPEDDTVLASVVAATASVGTPTISSGGMIFRSAFPGGGGQAAVGSSVFDADRVAYGTDTGGVRISNNGLASSVAHFLNVPEMRSRQTDGVTWSRTTAGRLYMTCGDGTSGPGGVFVCEDANLRGVQPWKRLDGVVAGSPKLVFDGGNNNVVGAPPSTYSRHYGTQIIIDESSIAGHTLVHVATVTNGAWRIKVRNSDMTPIEQTQYAGTASLYVRCIQMAVYDTNAAENDYSRLLIGAYHSGTPKQPLLCTNANTATASPTLSTATVTNAPFNSHAMGYIKASGGQATTVFAGQDFVYFSTNAFTAAAGSITFTNVSRTTAQADGPENNEQWISVGTTEVGTNHIILVGCADGGRSISGGFNTVWRGVIPKASTTPWSAVVWTALNGSTYWSEQVMNNAGTNNLAWITGQNTPGRNGTAAVSAFATSPTNPNRMYLVSRGQAFRSDDAGLHWYPGRQFGSADHSSVAWDQWTNTSTFLTTTGDWAINVSLDAHATEPHMVTKWDGANAAASWFDPKTGEAFIGVSLNGSHAVPNTDNTNTVWGMLPANLANTYSTIGATPYIDYNLDTGSGPSTSVAGVFGGCTLYGNGGAGATRAIVVATLNGQGLWYTKNEGTTWTRVTRDGSSGTVDPFMTANSYQATVVVVDVGRSMFYAIDRQTGSVWRCSVASDGTVSTATRIFVKTWTYVATREAGGYIDIDTANDRLWVSTVNDVYYINSASTVSGVAGVQNATVAGFGTNYSGELAGALAYSPSLSSVMVATLGLTSAGATNYPRNGSDGPRFLQVTNPTVSASWAAATDWTVAYDRSYRTAYQVPHSIGRNHNGSQFALTAQGMGCGVWAVRGLD